MSGTSDAYRIDATSVYAATDPWTAYAVTYTSADSTLRIYRDGVLSNSRSVTGLSIAANDLYLGFGAQLAGTGPTPTASRFFTGSLDDVRIYKRALSLAEIESLAGINHPPALTNPGNRSNAEGSAATLQLAATDQDGQTLTYSATGLPGGLTINTATGQISGNVAYTAAGNTPSKDFTVIVSVSDGLASDSETFTWTVTNVRSGLCEDDPTLVGCWPMEENGGAVVIDATANGNEGALQGTSPFSWVTPGRYDPYA